VICCRGDRRPAAAREHDLRNLFIGGANTSVEGGQYDAQPANERLPM
jgi:hypothetical protein